MNFENETVIRFSRPIAGKGSYTFTAMWVEDTQRWYLSSKALGKSVMTSDELVAKLAKATLVEVAPYWHPVTLK